MSSGGKLAGAAAGFAIGGPLGALIGGIAGHYGLDRQRQGAPTAETEIAFTVGVIALGAKMAKADGVVTADEVQAFKEVFRVPPSEIPNVARIFNLAKQDVAGYEAYAEQLATLFKDNRELLEDVLEGLFHIAGADGVMHPREHEYLRTVAGIFGFSDTEFGAIRARYIRDERDDAYRVLGVDSSISDKELKTRYRKLVQENHPDKAVARGLPPEFIKIATDKLAAINQAYERIQHERGL
jgi:DnaJ like chaperone protein